MTPFVFVSAIYGSTQFRTFKGIIFYIIVFSLLMSGTSEFYIMMNHWKKWDPSFAEVKQEMKLIPENGTVRANEFLAPHLSHRRGIHIYENTNPKEGASQKAMDADYIVLKKGFLGENSSNEIRDLRDLGYDIKKEIGDFVILHKE